MGRVLVATLVLLSFSGAVMADEDSVSCNMTLLANVDGYPAVGYNDCWGFVGQNGDEYAVIGTKQGTAFYRVTDPVNPVFVGFISGPGSTWRDMKFYSHGPSGKDYVYMGSEGGGGVQIVDVTDADNPASVGSYTAAFTTSHNIYIEQATGKLYGCGTNGGGLDIIDIATDPENPTFLGSWGNKYIHDLMVLNDTAYVACIGDGQLRLLDVSNPAAVTTLLSFTYSGAATHHAGVLENDHDFVITADEAGNGHIRCWDISDPLNPVQVSKYKLGNFYFSVHNVFIKGSVAYISYYKAGTRVVSFANPHSPVELGYYDTFPVDTPGLFTGNWGTYPYLPSGTIVSSDMSTGLYLLRLDDAYVGVSSGGSAPRSATLAAARPNPFNPVTTIPFALDARTDVDLSIYSPGGRLVKSLVRGNLPAGEHSIRWDGRDQRGAVMPSGIYLYKLQTESGSESKKLHLVR